MFISILLCTVPRGFWTEWGSWMPCTRSCTNGTTEGFKIRHRHCISYDGKLSTTAYCPGGLREAATCRLPLCAQSSPSFLVNQDAPQSECKVLWSDGMPCM